MKRQEVTQKLFDKVPSNAILNEVRESAISIGDIERKHLMTKKDIRNISAEYVSFDYKRDSNDDSNVHILVLEWQAKSD